jgi:hypothetical protein
MIKISRTRAIECIRDFIQFSIDTVHKYPKNTIVSPELVEDAQKRLRDLGLLDHEDLMELVDDSIKNQIKMLGSAILVAREDMMKYAEGDLASEDFLTYFANMKRTHELLEKWYDVVLQLEEIFQRAYLECSELVAGTEARYIHSIRKSFNKPQEEKDLH